LSWSDPNSNFANLFCREDDFVDHVFFDDLPGNDGSGSEHLFEHRVVAGVAEIGIDIDSDEVEKG